MQGESHWFPCVSTRFQLEKRQDHVTILTCATLMLNLLSPRLATSCNTARAKPRVHKCHGWQLALQKNNLKMQVEEISFSPFSRTSIEKKSCLCIWCVWFACTNCVHIYGNMNKKIGAFEVSVNHLFWLWHDALEKIQQSLIFKGFNKYACHCLLTHHQEPSHTPSFPASKCWDKEV